MGVHSCVVMVVSVVAMATGAKLFIFVIFVILKCNLPPINTPQGINIVTKNFLALF